MFLIDSFLSHSPQPIPEHILLALLPKYIQNLLTSHHYTATTLVWATIIFWTAGSLQLSPNWPPALPHSFPVYSSQAGCVRMWIQPLSCPKTSYRNHFRVKTKVFTRTCRDDVDGHRMTACSLLVSFWPHRPLCASRVCQKSSQLGILACVGLYVWNDLPRDSGMTCSLDFLKSLHKWYLLSQIFPDHSILNTPHLLSVLYFFDAGALFIFATLLWQSLSIQPGKLPHKGSQIELRWLNHMVY